jgi:hypothetical protein
MNTNGDLDKEAFRAAKAKYKKRIRYWKTMSWNNFTTDSTYNLQANRIRKILAKQCELRVSSQAHIYYRHY